MIDEQSRAAEYLSRAAEMRQLARNTRFPEVRTRLLLMAAGFERLADQVEWWDGASLVPFSQPPIGASVTFRGLDLAAALRRPAGQRHAM